MESTSTVKSDHKPLIFLYNLKNPASKLTRLRLDLEGYDFVVEYIQVSKNVVVDALSRIAIQDLKDQEGKVFAITLSMTKNLQNKIEDDDKADSGVVYPDKIKVIKEPHAPFAKQIPRAITTLIHASEKMSQHQCLTNRPKQ